MTDEISDVKSALNLLENAVWEVGSINNSGVPTDDTQRVRNADYINACPGAYAVQVKDGYRAAVVWYDANNKFLRDDYWLSGNRLISAPYAAAKIKIVISKQVAEAASLEWAGEISIIYRSAFNGNLFAMAPALNDGDDLNDLFRSGWYGIPAAAQCINTPNENTGARVVLVFNTTGAASGYRYQFYINRTTGEIYERVRTGGASGQWESWKHMNPEPSIPDYWQYREITDGQDVDNLRSGGFYALTYSGSYPNYPFSSARGRYLFAYPANANYLLQVATKPNGACAMRLYHDNIWDSWTIFDPMAPTANKNLYAQFLPANAMRYIYAKGKMWADLWNTEDAYKQAAADKKCWGISGDVQFTSDGKYIMYHDATITYNGESVPISSLTYEQVQSITLSYVGKQYAIPDFSTFLKICRDSGKVCFVETKGPSSAYAWTSNGHTTDFEAIISDVLSNGMQDSTVFIVPSADITYLHTHYPKLAVMVLCDNSITTGQIDAAINNPQRIVSGYPTAWTVEKVSQLHSAGRLAIGYTSRPQSLASINAMIELNLDAVCVFREPPDPLRITDTTVVDYNNVAIPSGDVDNSGIELTVMSYNVANYNNDTSVYVDDAQIVNIKKLISAYRPDIVGLQEHRQYLDSGNTKLSHTHLYTPMLPFIKSNTGCCIVSKINGNADLLYYSTNRAVRIEYFQISNKTLLVVDTHPTANYNNTGVDSADSIATRLTEYTELMQWIHGESTLKQYGSGNMISVQSWDWCVVTGDFNSITPTDMANLKTLVTARNFTMANGGWMGWIKTHYAGLSLDNILCSQNVIINSVEVPELLAAGLYSDHYPIISHITLVI